ncbi:hypothetical protein C8035_v009490 [Colletotrichum spinosum]|uniref:Uncharacterized protein n=1 Tax=Colletotrichum spinosum TaxID=1347390 RepID=A0A4R8Q1W4_9PEZI|nr:hypothetical protein C8035_v009490 [Colletotrichum spinosum]
MSSHSAFPRKRTRIHLSWTARKWLHLSIGATTLTNDRTGLALTSLEPRQQRWIDFGFLVCINTLQALKYVIHLRVIQGVEEACRIYASNKNYKKPAVIRITPKERPQIQSIWTIQPAKCNTAIAASNVKKGETFKLEIQEQ